MVEMKTIVRYGILAASLLLVLGAFIWWYGVSLSDDEMSVRIDVTVVDEATGDPVSEVFVRVVAPFHHPNQPGASLMVWRFTDSAGKASFEMTAGRQRRFHLLYTTVDYALVASSAIWIEKEGYIAQERNLEGPRSRGRFRSFKESNHLPHMDVRIVLKKVEESLEDK